MTISQPIRTARAIAKHLSVAVYAIMFREGGMAMLALRHLHAEPALNVYSGDRLWFGESPFSF